MKRIAQERERLVEAERAARVDVERVSRLKDQFLATLSHELRTPLSAILGWSKVLIRGKGSSAQLEKGLDAIARNATAQAKLIDDLLDMNRIVSGKLRLDVQPVDLPQVINAAVDALAPAAESKGLALNRVLDASIGSVSGDPHRLQQVVWNLLTNALKFTPRGGRVDVVLERVDSQVEIRVTDTGVGIDPAFLAEVFDRFRQADSSTTREHGGLGLGLSITRQLVELHGGSVRAESEGLGRGASFVVVLPIGSVDRAEEQDLPPSTYGDEVAGYDLIPLESVKVLVVDDEPDARELVKQILLECRADVKTAASAAEALDLLPVFRPDVLVSDIGMPVRDGYEFMQAVRQLRSEQGGRTPSIALTAFARPEDRALAMQAGYQVHVAKPVDPQELMARVASLAGRVRP
jgi:CheY-like chemotaxis protein/nitrogen-specific signal transduction histidine kinase